MVKVLCYMNLKSAVHYHRLEVPLNKLEREGKIELRVRSKAIKMDDLRWADWVIFNREIPSDTWMNVHILARAANCKMVIDVDDWWELPDYHVMKRNNERVRSRCLPSMSLADVVWTTHEGLADKIREVNPNVVIIPNAIDHTLKQWQPFKRRPSSNVRFGYLGGNMHKEDAELIGEVDGECYSVFYRDILKSIYLSRMPPNRYAEHYRKFDVSLVPLVDGEFERMKSPLKLAEAAATGTAVIVSPVMPYLPYLDDGVNCIIAHDWRDAIDRAHDWDTVKRITAGAREWNDVFDLDRFNAIRLDCLCNT